MAEKRLIDAKPLMENGWHLVKTGESNRFLTSMSLADVPTVDAVEVVHGFNTYDHNSAFECSICGFSDWDTMTADDGKYNYCPHCGAKMDGERRTDV